MPDFEWSPEAVEAAYANVPVQVAGWYHKCNMAQSLHAAVKAQPVVALPPCPTCKGAGVTNTSPMDRYSVTCPACNGSGADRMVLEAVLRAWIEEQRADNAPRLAARSGYGEGCDDTLNYLEQVLDGERR